MDTSTDLPPPATIIEAHMAHAATALPKQSGPTHNHPPYAEMIISAIKALNEKKGSSRKAISKFIDATYTDLPPAHAALLTHHLKRLKKKNHLLMVKHSYKLPKSAPPPVKRGRGRPPKQPKSISAVLGTGGTAPKKSRGRPPKPKSLSVVTGTGGGGGHALQKRGRGRPPKQEPINLPVSNSNGLVSVLPLLSPRPRGRPRKEKDSFVPPMVIAAPVVVSQGRPRGRPPKMVKSIDGGGDVGVGAMVLPGKRRGRPPKVDGEVKRSVGRPRKVSVVALEIKE